jgi:hypothetical protein
MYTEDLHMIVQYYESLRPCRLAMTQTVWKRWCRFWAASRC